jgi:tRNA U34 2-thiouridine synthase MnmA/TrmU
MMKGTLQFGPWYVAAKDVESNTLYVTNNTEVMTNELDLIVE